jgi:hypothetical protein
MCAGIDDPDYMEKSTMTRLIAPWLLSLAAVVGAGSLQAAECAEGKCAAAQVAPVAQCKAAVAPQAAPVAQPATAEAKPALAKKKPAEQATEQAAAQAPAAEVAKVETKAAVQAAK